MYADKPLQFAHYVDNSPANPANPMGTTVNLGLSNADHATVVALIGTPLAFDCEDLEVIITDGNTGTTGVDSSALLDIVIDPAGGTSWDLTNRLITSLMCGYMGAISGVTNYHRNWRFPLFIKAGATIGAVGRNIQAADKTCSVLVRCRGGVSDPRQWWCGTRVDAIGEDRANSSGTSVAPSATTNTFGSWTSVGSATARDYGRLIASGAPKSGTTLSVSNQIEVGYGSTRIGAAIDFQTSTVELASQPIGGNVEIRRLIPAGTQMQARGRANNNNSHTNQVIIHGVA